MYVLSCLYRIQQTRSSLSCYNFYLAFPITQTNSKWSLMAVSHFYKSVSCYKLCLGWLNRYKTFNKISLLCRTPFNPPKNAESQHVSKVKAHGSLLLCKPVSGFALRMSSSQTFLGDREQFDTTFVRPGKHVFLTKPGHLPQIVFILENFCTCSCCIYASIPLISFHNLYRKCRLGKPPEYKTAD